MVVDCWRSIGCAWLLCGFLATTSVAQTVRSGSINGTVTDESGGVLPGVAITVTGPALQVPQLTKTSDSKGEYAFTDLPPGSYRVLYELQGFARVAREDIRLTTGFTARLDVALKLATQSETVTVTGESPLIDVSNTRGGSTVTRELLEALPNNRNYQDVLFMAKGTVVTGPPQVGEIGFRALTGTFQAYGQSDVDTVIDGLDMQSNEAPDFASVQEVDVKTFGNTAEVANPGAVVQLVLKTGGNDFHGRLKEEVMGDKLQSANVDDALRAQGIQSGDALVYFQDFSGDLGGRIMPNRLWFYGAVRDQHNKRTLPGYWSAPGTDGIYGDPGSVPGETLGINRNQTIKLSYQANANHRVTGFFIANGITEPQALAGRFTPKESTLQLYQIAHQSKLEWQGTFSKNLLLDMFYGDGNYVASYMLQPESEQVPAMLNLTTQMQTGASFDSRSTISRPRHRRQLTGSLSYFPASGSTGSHEIKVGYRMWWESSGLIAPVQAYGYQLQFANSGALLNQPTQIAFKNFPVDGASNLDTYSEYVTDTWRATKRLTLNMGVRVEHSHAYVPATTKVQGPFGSGGSFAQVEGGSWNAFAPRIGSAFDLFDNGKTLLKASYGWYNNPWSDAYGQSFNQNTVTTATYRWRDLNGDRRYQPGEVNLDPNGSDFVSVAGATNAIVNPDLKWPHTHQIATSFEQQIGTSVSARALYVYKKITNDYQFVNVARPFSAFDIPVSVRDPGPDGVAGTADDGQPLTIYDYEPAFRGSRFVVNQQQTRPDDRSDHYNNIEFSLDKRSTGRWSLNTSMLLTRNHRWLVGVVQSPNDLFFPTDDTWQWSYRVAGTYRLPYDVQLSARDEIFSGLPGQRTVLFRGLPQLSTLTVPVEPYGAESGPIRSVMNVRGSKRWTIGRGSKLEFDLDVLNVTNTNVAWGDATGGTGPGINFQSGPSFGYVTRIVAPRVIRFGVALDF
jgi:outer membrane receptor protein involved in Fe transport